MSLRIFTFHKDIYPHKIIIHQDSIGSSSKGGMQKQQGKYQQENPVSLSVLS
jgi:hypothetical protein